MAEKLFQGLVLPADQVELDKMDLDREITKFFHVVGQVIHKSLEMILYSRVFVFLIGVFCRRW